MSEEDPDRSSRIYIARLYEQYSERLLGFFRASLPISKDDAVDLLQQTFEELLKWQRADPSRTIKHPHAFLFTIANRRLSAYYEKKRKTPDEPQIAEPELDAQAHRDDLEYMAALHSSQRGALRAMRRIEKREVQVMLYLRFWEGLTEERIGGVLDRSRSTVTGQLRRALATLRAKLAELESVEPGSTRTSTTLLEHWWKQLESHAQAMNPGSNRGPKPRG